MNTRNGHQRLYGGPAKRIPTQTWVAKLTDTLSVSWRPTAYAIGWIIVLLDVFYWRS